MIADRRALATAANVAYMGLVGQLVSEAEHGRLSALQASYRDGAQSLLGRIHHWADGGTLSAVIDPLIAAGERWRLSRERERKAAAIAHEAIRQAYAQGRTEVEIARVMGIARATVRLALGKL